MGVSGAFSGSWFGSRRSSSCGIVCGTPRKFATVGLSIKGCATKTPKKRVSGVRKSLISAEILGRLAGLARKAEVIPYTADYT